MTSPDGMFWISVKFWGGTSLGTRRLRFLTKLHVAKDSFSETRFVRPNLDMTWVFGGHIRARREKPPTGVSQMHEFSASLGDNEIHLNYNLSENFGHVRTIALKWHFNVIFC